MCYNIGMRNRLQQKTNVELAHKDWVLKELMATKRRIEKTFHERTLFPTKEMGDLKRDIASQTPWMIGLVVTMTIAIVLEVLFK